jgi:hypothetical protein
MAARRLMENDTCSSSFFASWSVVSAIYIGKRKVDGTSSARAVQGRNLAVEERMQEVQCWQTAVCIKIVGRI